jgi:repressor LexA
MPDSVLKSRSAQSAQPERKQPVSKARTKRDIRCARIYEFIAHFIQREGFSPTIRDICEGCEIQSTSTVHSYLKRLESEGKINYTSGKRRAITLTDPAAVAMPAAQAVKQGTSRATGRRRVVAYPEREEQMVRYPLLGAVTAGVPILAQEQIEREFVFSDDLFPARSEVFALKVKGDSMIDDAILDGDIVIVEKAETASLDSIVVGLIGDEATVKRFTMIDDKPYLMPANDAYDPIPFHSEDCRILGKVIGVMRTAVR